MGKGLKISEAMTPIKHYLRGEEIMEAKRIRALKSMEPFNKRKG